MDALLVSIKDFAFSVVVFCCVLGIAGIITTIKVVILKNRMDEMERKISKIEQSR